MDRLSRRAQHPPAQATASALSPLAQRHADDVRDVDRIAAGPMLDLLAATEAARMRVMMRRCAGPPVVHPRSIVSRRCERDTCSESTRKPKNHAQSEESIASLLAQNAAFMRPVFCFCSIAEAGLSTARSGAVAERFLWGFMIPAAGCWRRGTDGSEGDKWEMDHRNRFPGVALMWSCGAWIAAYQIAMAMDRRLILDDEEAASMDDRGEEDFRRLGFLS